MEVDLKYFENILKNILSGLLCEAKVKFGSGEYIERTPFLILSNYDNLFPMDQEVWNSRILMKHVKSVPWLTEHNFVTAAIHPYAWKIWLEAMAFFWPNFIIPDITFN